MDNIHKSSGNQIACGQYGAINIWSLWSRWALSSTPGNRVGGGYAWAKSVFQLIDRASTATANGSGTGEQIVEVYDSTSLQTDPIMGFPIPESMLGRQMRVETIMHLTSGKGVTGCLQGCSISPGCVVPETLSGCPDTFLGPSAQLY